MRTLFAKILLWFWCTAAITVVGSAFISALSVNDTSGDRSPGARLVSFQLEEARAMYESGGRPALLAFLENLRRIYGAKGILTDAQGRDLATGKDRSDLIRRAQSSSLFRIFHVSDNIMARMADDKRYWFFFVVPRQSPGPWFLKPEHLFMLGAAVLLCYGLALHLTQPVRKLQRAVERFGHGDLSARAGSTRRDELGQLAQTFDRMADRIQTLLSAERRLLLDISHELRSPLARLGVAIELARSGDSLDAALNRIQKESERLNSLVGQLLEVTRAEGDPNLLRRELIELDELVRQLVEDSRLESEAHGSRLVLTACEAVAVEGDPELLHRAIENILRNAIQHAPGNSSIQIALHRQEPLAILKIRDHGPGAPEEALARLFDPFYRVEADRSRSRGGIGLGLSIARRAVELHRGTIRARNAHPGLEVEMNLPLAGENGPQPKGNL
jgi:signal transduction histidine kinase